MSETPNKVGRPKKGAVVRHRYTLTLDPELMARVNAVTSNRSEFINQVLEQWFAEGSQAKEQVRQPEWRDGGQAGYDAYWKDLAELKENVLRALQIAGFSYLDRHEGGTGIELRLRRDYQLKEIVKGTPAHFNGKGWEIRPTEYAHFLTHVLPKMSARQTEMEQQTKEIGEHYQGIESSRRKGYYLDFELSSAEELKTKVPHKDDVLEIHGKQVRIKGSQDRSKRGKSGPPYKIRVFYWPLD